jgi:hypothetical protein
MGSISASWASHARSYSLRASTKSSLDLCNAASRRSYMKCRLSGLVSVSNRSHASEISLRESEVSSCIQAGSE